MKHVRVKAIQDIRQYTCAGQEFKNRSAARKFASRINRQIDKQKAA
jgi:hypothetical protein